MHLVDITMFYAANGGGVSTYINAKARWLAQHSDVRHSIVSPNIKPGEADVTDSAVAAGGAGVTGVTGRAGRLGMPSIAFPGLHGYRMPLSARAPVRLLRALRPDLIEAGDAGHCAWAALRASDALGIPAVAYYHSDLPRLMQRRFGKLASRGAGRYLARLYRRFDLVLAPSRLMVDKLADLGIDAVHQSLGIDTDVFRPHADAGSLRAQLGLAAGTRLLVYAGRFTAEKKLGLLIDAVRRLGRPYHLLLIGGGGAMPGGRAGAVHAAAPARVDTAITCLPFCADQRRLARLLAGCDVLVHPGDCETFGLIVLEAMACGVPVVATGGAVAELIDEHSGVLVRPDSVASLAEGIAAICQRDLAALGAAARHRACRQHDWNSIMPQLLGRYAGLLGRERPGELDMTLQFAGGYGGD